VAYGGKREGVAKIMKAAKYRSLSAVAAAITEAAASGRSAGESVEGGYA